MVLSVCCFDFSIHLTHMHVCSSHPPGSHAFSCFFLPAYHAPRRGDDSTPVHLKEGEAVVVDGSQAGLQAGDHRPCAPLLPLLLLPVQPVLVCGLGEGILQQGA